MRRSDAQRSDGRPFFPHSLFPLSIFSVLFFLTLSILHIFAPFSVLIELSSTLQTDISGIWSLSLNFC